MERKGDWKGKGDGKERGMERKGRIIRIGTLNLKEGKGENCPCNLKNMPME